MLIIAEIVHRLIQLLMWVIVIQAILSYFMDPYHPVRRTIDRMLNPLYAPIRRLIPPSGMFDFSPLVLIILLLIIDSLLTRLLVSLAY
jgi:YggT family protein